MMCRVSAIHFDDNLTVSFHVSGLNWHEAFYATTVAFGSGGEWHNIKLRDQYELQKRQATPTSQPTPANTLPFSVPPLSASATSINQPINFQLLDTVIMPPQTPIIGQFV
jgi:hypothetical protein